MCVLVCIVRYMFVCQECVGADVCVSTCKLYYMLIVKITISIVRLVLVLYC